MVTTRPWRWPSWVLTLDAAIAHGARIKGACQICYGNRDIDLVALRELKGGSYCLVNARAFRCPFTPGCPGKPRFHYLLGVYRPLWDEEVTLS
jgi:hypothetical protein